MDLDGVGESSGVVAAQPLSHLPTDILVGIFEWTQDSSIDRCLLKQTCSRIKWVLTEQMKAMDTINPSLPFTHELTTILPYLPESSDDDIWSLQLQCAKQGMLGNFNSLHAMGGTFSKNFVLASAHAGHLEFTLALLVMTPPADRPAFRNEALQFACSGGHLDLVKRLIKLGAEVHFNYDGAVTNAAAAGHLNVIKYLHIHDLDIIFTQRNTPLRLACEHGHLPVVQYLCESGSNIIALRNQPIILACKNGHLEVAKYLWSHGANNCPDFDTGKLIIAACRGGHLEIVQFLYSLGLSVSTDDTRPICSATESGNVELVKYLFSKGVNQDVGTGNAFKAACTDGNMELVKLLYSPNLGVDIIESAFVVACSSGRLEAAHFIFSLFSNGISNMNQALIEAGRNYHWDMVKMLHSLGADVHVLDQYAFNSACRCGRLDMVKLIDPLGTNSLVSCGAALIFACEGGNLDVVTHIYSLMEQNLQLRKLDSALNAAIRGRHFPVIKFLHSRGANIYATDGINNGTYISYAVGHRDLRLVKYLWSEIGDPQVYKSLNIDVHQLIQKTWRS